jgi:TonB family protein
MKINLKHKLPAISNAEIRSKKDFDGLLHRRNQFIIKRNKKIRLIKNLSWSMIALGILSTSIFLLNRHKIQKRHVFIAPVSTLEQDSLLVKKTVIDNEKTEFNNQPTEIKAQQEQSNDKAIDEKDTANAKKNPESKEVAKIEEHFQQAYPIVGFDSLYTYLNNSIRYPESTNQSDTVSGTVNVLFTIDTAGKAKNIVIENSLGEAFDEEAKRLLLSMPLWEPARMNGNAIETKMSLPLTFNYK